MEEDINRMKYILEFGEKTGINYTLETDDKKALQNILNELDRLSKENEDLKIDNNKQWKERCRLSFELDDSIPKSVIQDKIEELGISDTDTLIRYTLEELLKGE